MHQVNQLLAKYRPGELPAVGIHEDVSFAEYLRWPCLNASSLKQACKSAAHFLANLEASDEPSDAMRFGTLAHAGRLEPLAIAERYVVMPDLTEGITTKNGDVPKVPKATSEYKERVAAWLAAQDGREVVESEQYESLTAMNRRLLTHERSVEWLNGFGPCEVSIVWDDPASGVRCKARADKLLTHERSLCVDYKTTRDLAGFDRQIINLGYDVQAAFYLAGLEATTNAPWFFGIVAQESSSPHCVCAAELSPTNIEVGRRKMREAIELVCHGALTGDWPGPADPETWERPAWAMPDDEDGQSIGDWLRDSQPSHEKETANV